MYSCKVNDSYTVYVNYEYINTCVKASRKYPSKIVTIKNPIVMPSLNISVYHKIWGNGIVIESNIKNHNITVEFSDRKVRFIYPDAFDKGFLNRI